MLREELRYALRLLVRNPGFTAIATLSLALGIGANSAIFSLADALLLRPLAVPQPSAVVSVSTDKADDIGGISYPDFRDFRDKSHSFEGLTAFQLAPLSVARSANDTPHLRGALMVSENFFQALGVRPIMGRAFIAQEGEASGRNPVAVLAYDFWRSEFSADPAIVGRVIRVNGIDFDVIGVAPASFSGVDQYVKPNLYIPAAMMQRLSASPKNLIEDRSAMSFNAKGRLKPGVTREQAQSELRGIWKGLAPLHSEAERQRAVAVRTELSMRIAVDPPDASLIAMLMTLVSVVLLIACANVANLLLGRARGRAREIAIRVALGVSRARLVRQLLIESFLLALLGGIFGVGFAYAGIQFLKKIPIPTDLPITISLQLDGRVLGFTLGCAVVSALIFGLIPALRSVNPNLVPALKNAEAGSTGRQRLTGRNLLVVGQVAMSMVLLIATGMLIDGFRKILVMNPGFRIDHILTTQFDTSLVRYTTSQSHDFYRDLVARASSLPDVRAVTLSSAVPFAPQQDIQPVVPEGYQFPKGQANASVLYAVVDENYFPMLQMPVIRGRGFTADDKAGAPNVAVVNEQFAKLYWPNQDPVGKRLKVDSKKDEWVQVVGETRTAKYGFPSEPPTPFVYLPFAQNPTTSMVLFTETYGDPAAALPSIRQTVRSLDLNQPMFNVRTLEDMYQMRAISITRIIAQIVGSMGGAGLALAVIGLYGLVAYSVAQRTREIGVRMAIGAARSDVLSMVLRQGLVLAGAGIVVGGIISTVVSKLLASGLFGLASPNLATYVFVPLGLLVVTLASCYVPAFRASQVDPMVALRYE